MRRTHGQTFGAVLLLLAGGCAHQLATRQCAPDPPHDPTKIEVRYLGSGGIYLRWRDDAILLGPSFSNPTMARALIGRVKPDDRRIASGLERIDLRHVRAIFAGHAHYDHIADIPTIARKIPGVPVYVNSMGARLLGGEKLTVGTLVAGGEPVEAGSAFRVRAVLSGHAPQLCKWRRFPCVFAGGPEYEKDWTTPLTRHRLAAMRGGETLALVIEVFDGDRERFRVYYNDASADSPLGQTTGDFDLAILTIAQWNWARDYPRDLLSVLRPRHVVISHWDDFFKETTQTSKAVPLLTTGSVQRFQRIIDESPAGSDAGPLLPVCADGSAKWTMPAPGATMLFEPGGDA